MKLLHSFRVLIIAVVGLVFAGLAPVDHTFAMSGSSHEMAGMSHEARKSTECTTYCTNTLFKKEESDLSVEQNEDDDEPVQPFFVQFQGHFIFDYQAKYNFYSESNKEPPKTSLYIRYGLLRI